MISPANAQLLEIIKWATSLDREIAAMDFPDALCFLMKERGMTLELLEEKSGISVRTIKRLRNDPDYNVTREHIVALSVGMSLPPIVSSKLLRKAGLEMKNTITHNAYRMILSMMYCCDIDEINDFLLSAKLQPLTRQMVTVER